MSFVSYESYNNKALKGPGVTMDKLLKIGDIVDSTIIEKAIMDMPPLCNTATLVQYGEAYGFAKDDNGVSQDTYITFSFENGDWVFKGACFEGTNVNRCNLFDYANPTVQEYCLSKYYSEYVRAADRALVDENNGVVIENVSVIDEYMNFDAVTMAGYYFDVWGDEALEVFKDNWKDYQSDALYKPVFNLIENKNRLIGDVIAEQGGIAHGRISDLLVDAQKRSDAINGGAADKDNAEIERC